MRLAIVGTHSLDETDENYQKFKKQVLKWYPDPTASINKIVSGGAHGIDTFAEWFAKEYQIPTMIFHAKWKRYGKGAGPMRNTEIVDYCTELISFPDQQSVGTHDSMNKAETQKKDKHSIYWENIDDEDPSLMYILDFE